MESRWASDPDPGRRRRPHEHRVEAWRMLDAENPTSHGLQRGRASRAGERRPRETARTARAIRDLLRAGLAHRSSVSWWLAATATAATRPPSSAAPASKTAEGSRTTVVPWVVNEAQISHHPSEGPIPNPRRAIGRLGQLLPEVAFPSSRRPKVEFHSSCRRVDPFSPCLPDRGRNQDPCPNDCHDDQNVPHRHSGDRRVTTAPYSGTIQDS